MARKPKCCSRCKDQKPLFTWDLCEFCYIITSTKEFSDAQARIKELESQLETERRKVVHLQQVNTQCTGRWMAAEGKIERAIAELHKLGIPGFLIEALQTWISTPGNLAENHWHVNSEIQEQQIEKALESLETNEKESIHVVQSESNKS